MVDIWNNFVVDGELEWIIVPSTERVLLLNEMVKHLDPDVVNSHVLHHFRIFFRAVSSFWRALRLCA